MLTLGAGRGRRGGARALGERRRGARWPRCGGCVLGARCAAEPRPAPGAPIERSRPRAGSGWPASRRRRRPARGGGAWPAGRTGACAGTPAPRAARPGRRPDRRRRARCCSRRRGGSSRSMPRSRATPHLEAVYTATNAARLGDGSRAPRRQRARRRRRPARRTRAICCSTASRCCSREGYAAAAPILQQALAVRSRRRSATSADYGERGSRGASRRSSSTTQAWIAARRTPRAGVTRGRRALVLPVTLNYLAAMRIYEGDLDAARRCPRRVGLDQRVDGPDPATRCASCWRHTGETRR